MRQGQSSRQRLATAALNDRLGPLSCDYCGLGFVLLPSYRVRIQKADVMEHSEVFYHVGLLFNEPPSTAGLFFI